MAEQRSVFRFSASFALALCFHILPVTIVLAQQADSAATAALPPQQSKPEHRDIKAGPVTGRITVLRSTTPFPAGGSAFATVEVGAEGKAKLAGTEIVFEADMAEIRNVTGAVAVDGTGRSRIARIETAPKGGKVSLLVELALAGDTSPGTSTLNVTLKSPDGGHDVTRVAWPVIDCAGGFYDDIVKVRNGSGSRIEEAVEASQERDKRRAGRWLFRPQAVSTARRGKCLKSVKRWSRRHGRSVYVCTQFEETAAGQGPSSVPYERKVYAFASRLVSSRARDHELSPRRDSGWAIKRVSGNLDGFLKQPPHPAICNGPIAVFDYFDERMAGFMKRADTYDDMAEKSHALALLRTVEAVDILRSRTDGHPGWGNAPLLPDRTDGEIPLKVMADRLARATGDMTLGDEVAGTGNAYSAIEVFAGFMKNDTAKSLDKESRVSLNRALGALEAADYIAAVAGHYKDLRHALAGSMTTLRKAHGDKCTCGG